MKNIMAMGNLNGGGYEKKFTSVRKVYSADGISPTLVTAAANGDIVKVIVNETENRVPGSYHARLGKKI